MSFWYEEPALARRLYLERQAMKEACPQFRLIRRPDGQLSWRGTLTSNTRRVYDVEVCYPANYPDVRPRLQILSPRVARSHHMYDERTPCLIDPRPGPHGWNPSSSTALTVVLWGAAWILCYEIYLATGLFPERSHLAKLAGEDAGGLPESVLQYIESLPIPLKRRGGIPDVECFKKAATESPRNEKASAD